MFMDRKEIFSRQRLDGLWRLASSVLSDTEEAKDVVQDVMMKVCVSPAPIINVDSYLVRAVVNTCIDRIRKRDRVSELVSDVISESRIESFDDREIVRYAISRLPERQRIAVHLKDIEGYTTEEVAGMMEIEENHLRTILCRARKAMRDIIEKELYGEVQLR